LGCRTLKNSSAWEREVALAGNFLNQRGSPCETLKDCEKAERRFNQERRVYYAGKREKPKESGRNSKNLGGSLTKKKNDEKTQTNAKKYPSHLQTAKDPTKRKKALGGLIGAKDF